MRITGKQNTAQCPTCGMAIGEVSYVFDDGEVELAAEKRCSCGAVLEWVELERDDPIFDPDCLIRWEWRDVNTGEKSFDVLRARRDAADGSGTAPRRSGESVEFGRPTNRQPVND